MSRSLLCMALVGLVACRHGAAPSGQDSGPVELCRVDEVPVEATLRMGWQDDGTFVSTGGQVIAPAGPSLVVEGMPVDVAVHPDGLVAWVTIASNDERQLLAIDIDRLEVLQTLDRSEAHVGLEVEPDGGRVWAAGGADGTVQSFRVDPDGRLELERTVEIGGTVAGLALDGTGDRLYAGTWNDDFVAEIDTATGALLRTIPVTIGAWDLIWVPGRDELVVSDLSGRSVSVVDLLSGAEAAVIEVSPGPAGMAVSPDGATVYVAASAGDRVLALDMESRSVRAEGRVAEDDLLDEEGLPLPHSNVNAVWLDPTGGRLYAARGADNAVTVLDAESLERLGAFPVARYPMDLELGSTGQLVVAEYKGGGIGPAPEGASDNQKGSITVVDVDEIDLAVSTEEVRRLTASPRQRFPFECDGFFPIPSKPGQVSPIEHVVLVVKENKTLDCLFGDMGEQVPGLDAAPGYQIWPAEVTANQRALIQQFNISDNFYTESLESDAGHLLLTSTHLTHWAEWMWMETDANGGNVVWPVDDSALPSAGNFFVRLLDQGGSLAVYGEIVGMNAVTADGRTVMEYSDLDYPGGPAFNQSVPDEEKARYLAEKIATQGLPDFSYVSLPDDHTMYTGLGGPTPESMVADNDLAVGILVEAISRDPALWEKTAIFILEDDPQGCDDHVDAARSFLIVASPWARRGGYVSHTNAGFISVYATIEAILGIPPLGRPDAAATPLWDLFQPVADTRPFELVPRQYPYEVNDSQALAVDLAARLDFSGPDRVPELGPLLDTYLRYRRGDISRAQAERELEAPRARVDAERWEALEEESEEETYAFDRDLRAAQRWAAARGLSPTWPPGREPRPDPR